MVSCKERGLIGVVGENIAFPAKFPILATGELEGQVIWRPINSSAALLSSQVAGLDASFQAATSPEEAQRGSAVA